MKKSRVVSDIKLLIKEAKTNTICKNDEYWKGYLKACDDISKAVENTNQPKQIFSSREHDERGWQPK